jgi:hypothetical protein
MVQASSGLQPFESPWKCRFIFEDCHLMLSLRSVGQDSCAPIEQAFATMELYDFLRYRRMFWHYRRWGPIVGIVLGLGLCVSGLVMVGCVGVPAVLTGMENADWPSTTGTVTLSRAGWTLERSPLTDRLTRYYRAEVKYEYQVNGKKYESNNIAMNSAQISYPSRGAAELVTKHYPQGATVTVYFNPNEPHVAVLKKGQSYMSIGPLVVGVPMALLGILMVAATGAFLFFVWTAQRP